MVHKVELSEVAKTELKAIVDHISESNPSAALRIFYLIRNRCASLDLLPDRGKAVMFEGQTFRHAFVKNYIIRYRVLEESVQILRIVDGRRDLSALWDDPI